MSEGLRVEESESDVVDDQVVVEEGGAEESSERREDQRVDVDFPVRVQAPVRAEGQALELSEGGVRVEIDADVSQAVHVSIQFDLPDHPTPVGTLADIRWHEQIGPKADPRWVCGLRFSELDDEVEEALVAHLETARSDED